METKSIGTRLDSATKKGKAAVTETDTQITKAAAAAGKVAGKVEDGVQEVAEAGGHEVKETAKKAGEVVREIAATVVHAAQGVAEKVVHFAEKAEETAKQRGKSVADDEQKKP